MIKSRTVFDTIIGIAAVFVMAVGAYLLMGCQSGGVFTDSVGHHTIEATDNCGVRVESNTLRGMPQVDIEKNDGNCLIAVRNSNSEISRVILQTLAKE